jgi:lipoate-protein ligase B
VPDVAAWTWLGRTSFDSTVALQERLRDRLLRHEPSARGHLLLCEHDPVVTLGRRAKPENVLVSEDYLAGKGVALRQASRGGDVTFHGPGQLVGYPVLRLRRGVVHHVEAMANAVVLLLEDLGIRAAWSRERPGVWVGTRKICAVGVHVRRGVAIHGFALNIRPELGTFSAIVPCGLRGVEVTSVAALGVAAPSLPSLAPRMAAACSRAFDLNFSEIPSNAFNVLPSGIDNR